MGYIENLRKTYGHEMIMTVGCGVLIENEKGQILLQKRSDNGQWCVPGGALEPLETYYTTEGSMPEAAVVAAQTSMIRSVCARSIV